jgi:hypothetical protein
MRTRVKQSLLQNTNEHAVYLWKYMAIVDVPLIADNWPVRRTMCRAKTILRVTASGQQQ